MKRFAILLCLAVLLCTAIPRQADAGLFQRARARTAVRRVFRVRLRPRAPVRTPAPATRLVPAPQVHPQFECRDGTCWIR